MKRPGGKLMSRPATATNLASRNPCNAVVRTVEPADFSLAVETWKTAFAFTDEERWKRFAFEVSDFAVGAFVDNYPHALATVILFDANFNGRVIKCGGIAGVASSPPMRKKGLVRAVLKECVQRLHDQEVEISALWPFSYPFYERMGYALTDLQYDVTQTVDSIPNIGDSSNFRPVKLDDCAELMPMHKRWTKTFNLSLERSLERWQRQLTRPEKHFALYLHDDGYMIWNLNNKERKLEVVEWAHLTNEAFLDGLSLIKNCGQLSYDTAEWTMHSLEPWLKLGVQYPTAKISVRSGMMSRVVHKEAFFKNTGLEAYALDLSDPLGVSASVAEKGDTRPGPGELIQVATGLLSPCQKKDSKLSALYKAASSAPAFSIEQY